MTQSRGAVIKGKRDRVHPPPLDLRLRLIYRNLRTQIQKTRRRSGCYPATLERRWKAAKGTTILTGLTLTKPRGFSFAPDTTASRPFSAFKNALGDSPSQICGKIIRGQYGYARKVSSRPTGDLSDQNGKLKGPKNRGGANTESNENGHPRWHPFQGFLFQTKIW